MSRNEGFEATDRDDDDEREDEFEDDDELETEDDDDLDDDDSEDDQADDDDDDLDDDGSIVSSSRRDSDEDEERDDDPGESRRSRRSGRGGRGRRGDRSRDSDGDDDPIIGSSDSRGRRGYTFELDNDVVTNLRRVKGGRSKPERIEAGESWVFTQEGEELFLTHSESYDSGTEVSIYTGPAVGEVFTRISESFLPFNSNPTTPII